MRIARTYATPDGGSSMDEIEIETSRAAFVPGCPEFGVSDPISAAHAKFLNLDAEWIGGWHPTPVKQFLIVLRGGFEIRTSDGQTRQFGRGDIVLLADTEGRGHHTTMSAEAESWILAVALE